MKICYQVATPDVAIADSVTAYQGPLEKSFSDLASYGYEGVELMTLNPSKLDWNYVKETAEKNNLSVILVCTGEIYGQLGLTYTDPKAEIRKEAIERTKEIIDFASFLGANVNIGRIRGGYRKDLLKEQTEALAIEAFREVSDYASTKNVNIALESVTIMQTNFINTLAEAADMVDRVNRPNFKLMMDIFHLNLEEKDVIEAIKKYSSYNIHVHLADNNRRYPGHCGLDFEKIVRTFKECGYSGNFCTEIYQIPNQEEAAKGAVAYLKPIMKKIYEV
ncbi:MAG: sugar phosphate isomerase/epimerase [Clostridium sp.]|uniref:sugar phosphate isomerase/epimerase family protein n=1 Tax=Clostridium culturomicium TaxID=1499683 RepID=UPI00058C06E9|nr:sugar phosphate isomerase/epimerase [Clostridium culturomicium]MDU4889494.1 sugar phosphate isomerase/epimerase [Clostridium sp.]MDU7082862.1 sugar phosphate isomerase/epimerase [Clostridium sp.]